MNLELGMTSILNLNLMLKTLMFQRLVPSKINLLLSYRTQDLQHLKFGAITLIWLLTMLQLAPLNLL
jgi:hypothetical protein